MESNGILLDNGDKIKEYRLKNKLTKRAFAKEIDSPIINIYRWELHKRPISRLWLKELRRLGVL